MNVTNIESFLISIADAAGLKKLAVTAVATVSSFGVHDVAQLVAVGVAIASGVMAIRHYIVAIKLNKLKMERLLQDNNGVSSNDN